MSEENEEYWRKVTSVGNSWIVCKSKTYKGHVYYFNTLTGKAAWNLSPEEMLKAKHRTKSLKTQPSACPEPQEKPPSTILAETKTADKKTAEELIQQPFAINTLAEQPSTGLTFSNFTNNPATFNSPPILGVMPGCIPGAGVTNPALNALCMEALTNPVHTLNLNTNTFFNPKVWDVPQTQQVLLASTAVPLGNSPQVVTSHVSGQIFMNNVNPSLGTRKFYPRHNNYGWGGQHNFNKNIKFTNKSDLRQKLVTKKRPFNVPGGLRVFGGMRSKSIKSNDGDFIENDESEESNTETWVRKNEDLQLHEVTTRFDLEPLKKLAPLDCNQDAWFIVMDLDILMNEFKFLNTLADSDEQCHLMVPETVMSQLKEYVTTTNNVQCRRILRFLSQQIEIGYACLAEEPSCDEGSSTAQLIYTTCTELIKRKYHLILLTVDNELLSYKDSSDINIFSMNEIKQLLINTKSATVSTKKTFALNRLINKIKITVPNDTTRDIDSTSNSTASQTVDPDERISLIHAKPKIKEQPNESTVELKRTVDAGIQTDFDNIFSTNIPNAQNTQSSSTNLFNEPTEKQNLKEVPSNYPSTDRTRNGPDKKIKLKRSISYQPAIPTTDSDEKRPFKWRRGRSHQGNEQTSSTNNQNNLEIECQPTFQSSEKSSNDNKSTIESVEKETPTSNNKHFTCTQAASETTPQTKELASSPNNKNTAMKEFQHRRTCNIKNLVKNVETPTNQQAVDHESSSEPITLMKAPTQMSSLNKEINSNNIRRSGPNTDKISEDMNESSDLSICTEQNQSRANVTIEETSTSGISNTESNAESYCGYYTPNQRSLLFPIDSLTMEEYLKINCDEWVSRFIQIMEEVLTQVLQQEPAFTHSEMPPPWTLYEAAQCVAMKFSNHQNIKDAVYQLSHILFQLSNDTGSVMKNITPYQFMEIYSFGFNLLSEMEKVIPNCEDIEIAVDSLTKLLHDIRNPNIDNSTNEQFNDNILEMTSRDAEPLSDSNNETLPEKEPALEKEKSEETYNSPPKSRKLSNEDLAQHVKFIRKIDVGTSFFSHLGGKKNKDVTIHKNKVVNSQITSHDEQSSTDLSGQQDNNSQTVIENVEQEPQNIVQNSQQKVIRNFTICAEFEKKLSNKYNSKTFEDHDEELDYEDDYGEYLTEEYCSEDENENVHRNNANFKEPEAITDENEVAKSPTTVDPYLLSNDDDIKKFKYLMSTFMQNIREALDKVRVLCNKCYEELKNPERLTCYRNREQQRCELQEMAENAHLHLIRLYRSLESMLDHESTNPSHNICNLLKQADIDVRYLDSKMIVEYRTTVANCKDHVDVFLKAIQSILNDFKTN